MTQINARMATADHERQGRPQYKSHTAYIAEFASGKSMDSLQPISARNSVHNFNVKFS